MIIYNITVKVDAQIADQWLQWLFNVHLPDVMQAKCFIDYKVVRLLEIDDSEGPTYAIQYFADSKEAYKRYIEIYEPELRKKSIAKWKQQFVAFSSVMEVVQQNVKKYF